MIKKCVILGIFLFFLCIYALTMCERVQAQTVTPGVGVGDTFTYDFMVFWSSTDPNAVPPTSLLNLNQTKFIQATIAEISGPVVFINITTHFKNGTEARIRVFVHLLSGNGDGFGLLVSPNLSENSLAYPMGLESGNRLVINEVVAKTYPFGKRETLHATLNRTNLPNCVYVFYDVYFDRDTGVMLEWSVKNVTRINPREEFSLLWKIREFNVTSENLQNQQADKQLPSGLIAVIMIIAVLTVILIYRRKGRKRK